MAVSIAEYYITEKDNWVDTVNFHLEETQELNERLNEVMQLNTIPKLAAYVEQFLNRLMISTQTMMALKETIQKSEIKLYTDKIPVENHLITTKIKEDHGEMRNAMLTAEKEFLGTKYDCNKFLTETVYEQLNSRSGGH